MGFLNRRRKPLMWVFIGLLALSLLGGFAFMRPFQSAAGAPIQEDGADVVPPPPLPGKRTTFLIMGVDDRPDRSGRADTMIVASFDPATKRLGLISLARDTWAQIPGLGYDKINHSYAFGGEPLAVSTVQRLLGIPIDQYVSVSFEGFQQIVDALGGVEINAEKRLYYTDPYDTAMGPGGLVIDIQPGLQKMDGLNALKYSRFRMDDEGDFGRMRRQQQVIKAVMNSAAQPAVIGRLPQLVPALTKAVHTNFSLADLLSLAANAKEMLAQPLNTGTLGGEGEQIDGVYYLIPDLMAERQKAYEVLVGTPPTEAFLQRTREDKLVYDRALATARAESAQVAAKGPSGDPSDGGKTTEPGSPSGGQPPTGKPTTPPTTKPKPKPVTVSVIDATGKGLATAYVQKLKAAGFRVASVAKASSPVAKTVALDHAGQLSVAERVKAVIPKILWVSAPDPQASQAVEIVLGMDLITKP